MSVVNDGSRHFREIEVWVWCTYLEPGTWKRDRGAQLPAGHEPHYRQVPRSGRCLSIVCPGTSLESLPTGPWLHLDINLEKVIVIVVRIMIRFRGILVYLITTSTYIISIQGHT